MCSQVKKTAFFFFATPLHSISLLGLHFTERFHWLATANRKKEKKLATIDPTMNLLSTQIQQFKASFFFFFLIVVFKLLLNQTLSCRKRHTSFTATKLCLIIMTVCHIYSLYFDSIKNKKQVVFADYELSAF